MPISLGKSTAEIDINLDRPAGPYYPGDVIQATITLNSRKEASGVSVRAMLQAWEVCISEDSEGYSSKKTTLDAAVVEEILVEGTTLTRSLPQIYQVGLPIPPDAFSPYASSSIRGGWRVKASVDRGRKTDSSAEVDLPLVVPPPGEKVQPGQFGESSHPDHADLLLWLPGLEWVEGDTIQGRLLIAPGKKFDAGEVRVQLVRQEKVQAPRYKSSNTDWIDRVVLAGKTRFQAGQAAEMAFEFPIPVMGCPTRRTDSTTVTYTLRASLTRRLRKSFTTSTEIWIYNGQGPG